MNSNPLPASIQPLGLSVATLTRPKEGVLITRYALDAVVIRKLRSDPVRSKVSPLIRLYNNGTGGRRHSGRRLRGLPPRNADGQTTCLLGTQKRKLLRQQQGATLAELQ